MELYLFGAIPEPTILSFISYNIGIIRLSLSFQMIVRYLNFKLKSSVLIRKGNPNSNIHIEERELSSITGTSGIGNIQE